MIPETPDLRTSLILLSSQRITGKKAIEASTLEPLTTNRCRGRHLTFDDDTLTRTHSDPHKHSASRADPDLSAEDGILFHRTGRWLRIRYHAL
jgi:hypothetical protein